MFWSSESNWARWSLRNTAGQRRPQRPRKVRPQLEVLADRTVPNAYPVTSLALPGNS